MPGIAKVWNEFATNAKIKDLDKKIAANKSKVDAAKKITGSVADKVGIGAGVKTVKKYKTERHQLMDEISRGQ